MCTRVVSSLDTTLAMLGYFRFFRENALGLSKVMILFDAKGAGEGHAHVCVGMRWDDFTNFPTSNF